MLGALGLSPEQESVYTVLTGRAQATPAELGDALHLPTPAVEAALSHLMASGLVKTTPGGGFAAAPPAVALGSLISERQAALRSAELALVTLAEEHRKAMAGRSISELIEVVTGVEAVRHRFAQVQHAARTEVRFFITTPFVAVPPGANPVESQMVAQGVRYRVVVDRAALAEPGVVAETIVSLRDGVEVRVAESLPTKLVLADTELGLVPLTVSPGDEPGAVLLHRAGLLTAMDALFELVWRHAYPLSISAFGDLTSTEDAHGEGGNIPTGLDRRILALLLAGLTDQAVATQLDLSLRTLQRRLRHLMDLAGAQSRMQLACYAVRHDWT
ncbi:Sugar-specific transcriptional regulator TrmB [Micromonospora purpureochromogenes]|uniref:Sugar-specific transcriptional regulator TrmB n=1 Tax=Micromonospora purpureochromogenes TaxID=47872 RepID=A0A1C4Z6H9_9ACTN|nr:LuxR C-terminal-related transcriptional regulator [Micromonospora purpureochromogenes]SCF28484.1 Sugar-specific transcriptional regulator TrmB [Micromonospora purpureochromogenes]